MYNILVNYWYIGIFFSDGFYISNVIREFCNVMIWFIRIIMYLIIFVGIFSGCVLIYFLIFVSRNGLCLVRCFNLWIDKYKLEEILLKLKSINIMSKDKSCIKYILFKFGKMLRSMGKCLCILSFKDL